MKSIVERLNESLLDINESFESPFVRKLAKAISNSGQSFKKWVWNCNSLKWDEITESDINYYDVDDNDNIAHKAANKIISGRESGYVFGMNDKGDILWSITSNKVFEEYRNNHIDRNYKMKSTELLNIVDEASRIAIIHTAGGLATWEKQLERRKSQDGMILVGDPEFNKQWAKKNMERYKNIIAKNAAKKSDDFKQIDKDVKTLVNTVLDICTESHKEPEKYSKYCYEVSSLNKSLYEYQAYYNGKTTGHDGLLVLYQRLCESYMQINGRDEQYADMYKREYDRYKKQILEKITEIQNKINKFNEKVTE